MQHPDAAIRAMLAHWDLNYSNLRLVDSSRSDSDVRLNYILDRRYVLRMNSAPVVSDRSLGELNRLIGRYRVFGLAAPLFLPLPGDDERFILRDEDGAHWYLSEYLDMPTAEELPDALSESLDERITAMTAAFAQRFRGEDLIDTYGMYSLFDLSPYDRLIGHDEKAENCRLLCQALRDAGEAELADRAAQLNTALRRSLLALYPTLPRCVFQGDENDSNLCLNEQGEICGLFDFNMAGTDVCVNYLANHAAYSSALSAALLGERTAEWLLADLERAEAEGLTVIRRHYRFTAEEELAYPMLQTIVALFQWPQLCDFRKGLKQPVSKDTTVRLISLLCDRGEALVSLT